MSARLPINLMLVEDERIVAFDLKRQLQGFGYHVSSVVASGEQAVSRITAEKPDLILMDIHLEGTMDGIEAAIQIRASHQIPVIFPTAYAGDDPLPRLDSLLAAGHPFTNLDTGDPLAPVRSRVVSANVYLGAAGIVEALARGAALVITGRVADASLKGF